LNPLVEALRLRDHELTVPQVGDAEVRDRSLGFLGDSRPLTLLWIGLTSSNQVPRAGSPDS